MAVIAGKAGLPADGDTVARFNSSQMRISLDQLQSKAGDITVPSIRAEFEGIPRNLVRLLFFASLFLCVTKVVCISARISSLGQTDTESALYFKPRKDKLPQDTARLNRVAAVFPFAHH